MTSPRARTKRAKNPLSRFLPWYFGAVFALFGLGLFAGQDWVFSRFVLSPVFLVSGLAGLTWTFFAVRMGRITMVSSSTGTTHVYERRREPVMFGIVVAIYVAFCLMCLGIGAWTLFA